MGAIETQGFKLDNTGRRIVVDPVTRIEGHMRCEVNAPSLYKIVPPSCSKYAAIRPAIASEPPDGYPPSPDASVAMVNSTPEAL